jgi:hypothetical protein
MVIGSIEFKEREVAPEAPAEGRKKLYFGADGLPRTVNSIGVSTPIAGVSDSDPRLSDARPPTSHDHDSLYYRKNTAVALSLALG